MHPCCYHQSPNLSCCPSFYVPHIVQIAKFQTPPYGIRADLRQLTLSQKTFGTRYACCTLLLWPGCKGGGQYILCSLPTQLLTPACTDSMTCTGP